MPIRHCHIVTQVCKSASAGASDAVLPMPLPTVTLGRLGFAREDVVAGYSVCAVPVRSRGGHGPENIRQTRVRLTHPGAAADIR